ncbi:hypothetical protein [Glutamicibacter ardleyensis]|uniref:Uncharacterized protein n=1 Tax=Glutamicibacter ardleyensis TaxID=225894 RepID=A0ABQ2DG86_9MICC|nr:hypothetical protein [Glutamicibacter ardleyensis]GGJ56195.1 hypothetical protein GCM10007173_13740 [Glutamicibacter ardleyensis]
MNDKPGWRERFANEIEAGKQEQRHRIENIDAEQLKYERRLKQFKEAKRLNRFIPSQPTAIERSQPREEEPEW